MAISPRVPVLAALAVVPMVLASSCGSEATGARTTLATVQNTSYVVEDPVPTTAPPTTQPLPEGGGTAGRISPTEQLYTIVAGDSVSRIASIHDITMDVLVAYNAWPDGINHFLVVGEQVKIPPNSLIPGTGTADSGSSGGDAATGGDSGSTDTTPDATEAPDVEIACEHTVVEGDNPSRLADQYGVSLDELNNVNLDNSAYNRFLIGDKINIPAGGDC